MRFTVVFLLWLAFSAGCGYALAGMGTNSFGTVWVALASAFAGACTCPLLLAGLPD